MRLHCMYYRSTNTIIYCIAGTFEGENFPEILWICAFVQCHESFLCEILAVWHTWKGCGMLTRQEFFAGISRMAYP